jgi:predicted nucleotidyltransferase
MHANYPYVSVMDSNLPESRMMKPHTRSMSRKIRAVIQQVDQNASVILFGSRARGDERADSDWDILVLTDGPVDLQQERRFRVPLYELELETGASISMLMFSRQDWSGRQSGTPLFREVSHEGIVL